MSDVFISYKSEDRRCIQSLLRCLQSDGYSVWWDEQIGTGDVWREKIERELDDAVCVIVVWSKYSVRREGAFVREEASRAPHRGVYLPVLIDSVSPPLGFGEMQATSLVGWKGNSSDHRYLAVRSGLQRLLPSGHVREPTPSSRKDRRSVLIGGGVAAAVVASAGAWEFLRASASAPSRSIAVLPFENLSGDPSQTYFSDGIDPHDRTGPQLRVGRPFARSSSVSEQRAFDDDGEHDECRERKDGQGEGALSHPCVRPSAKLSFCTANRSRLHQPEITTVIGIGREWAR